MQQTARLWLLGEKEVNWSEELVKAKQLVRGSRGVTLDWMNGYETGGREGSMLTKEVGSVSREITWLCT